MRYFVNEPERTRIQQFRTWAVLMREMELQPFQRALYIYTIECLKSLHFSIPDKGPTSNDRGIISPTDSRDKKKEKKKKNAITSFQAAHTIQTLDGNLDGVIMLKHFASNHVRCNRSR